ncbi:hypothetical protein [Methylopila turkensis]|uniref:Uncharacterized protein n=1 Tax=Methylopila turkensis TaxID=1437816 RepID=A0A9W6N6C1_9HYPH|nr:hypothetical protein [Methylopila turkensis]GLK79240.1 hypothetical protein GCM10008174_09810 [Methylopila turkensis]
MANFPIIATVLSMVLGLSVTRLLLGLVTVFRIRRVSPPDWVSLLTMMLFLSAALLLPSRSEDEQLGLRQYYETNGRYALLCLSSYLILGFVANAAFYDAPLMSLASLVDLPMIALPLVAFFAKRRPHYAGVALLYVPLVVVDTCIALAA